MRIQVMTTRISLILSIMKLSYLNSYAQADNKTIERMIVSYGGDAMIAHTFELVVKNREVYALSSVANYWEGSKQGNRVKMNGKQKEKIFDLVDQLKMSDFAQTKKNITEKVKYYSVKFIFKNGRTYSARFEEEGVPADLKKLYDAIVEKE